MGDGRTSGHVIDITWAEGLNKMRHCGRVGQNEDTLEAEDEAKAHRER